MRKPALLAVALAATIVAGPALAQSGHDEDYARFDQELQQADAHLNEVWQSLFPQLKAFDPAKADALREEQRAWIAFMEKACGLYPGSGGFWGDANFFACKLELIQQRSVYLQDMEQVITQ